MNASVASRVVPLVVLGETRRAAVGQALTGCLTSWRSGWSAADDPITVQIHESGHLHQGNDRPLSAASDGVLARSERHGAVLKVDASVEFPARLIGVGAVGTGGAVAGQVARELYGEMLQSLCRAVVTRAGVNDASIERSAGDWNSVERSLTRWLTVGVTFGASRAVLHLALNPILIDFLAPIDPVAQSSGYLSTRRSAIAEETVRVEAVLGDAEITLRELVHLTEGDVIVLDQPLGQAGHLFTDEGRRVASIVLGRSDSQRAVSLAR